MIEEPDRPRVAAFRPAGDRSRAAERTLAKLGAEPVIDPMVEVAPTEALPPTDVAFVVLTSSTAATILREGDWKPDGTRLCAIGERTAAALEEAGYPVDIVPETASSAGIVAALESRVAGRNVAIARSDHGSDVLPSGLRAAGATVEETILYRLVRPTGAGESVRLAASGALDAALFTSPLTVEHFLEIAEEFGRADSGLDGVLVGAIGEPTRRSAQTHGLTVDVVPEETSFAALAQCAIEALRSNEPADP